MAEYQYYEFQAIDRALTEREQAEVSRLSSRVEPHPSRAVFVYHYSDFPRNPKDVLARYFDAMLYLANWGTRRLMFRFPRNAIDLEAVQPFWVDNVDGWAEISFETAGEYVILDIRMAEEGGALWVEGPGWLDALLPLRSDLMRQDYRLLYLAWLRAITLTDLGDDALEPPVPPGLGRLSPALREFVELFEVDTYLLREAAAASSEWEEPSAEETQRAIALLPQEERDGFLLRLARGEAHLSAALQRRLGHLLGRPAVEPGPRRTAGQLLAAADRARQREEEQRKQQAEAERIRELEAWAPRGPQAWPEVEALIETYKPEAYREAVGLLVKLRELAVHRGAEAEFEQRLRGIRERYQRRYSLLSKMVKAGLLER